jgi:hypothetical protein
MSEIFRVRVMLGMPFADESEERKALSDDEGPFYKMVREVVSAIAAYDKTRDHMSHKASGDCVRCRLVDALPPFAQAEVAVALKGRRS